MTGTSNESTIRLKAISLIEPLESRQLMSASLTVPATAVVFAAGGSSLPDGTGTLPPEYTLPAPATAGTVLTFASVTGKIDVNTGTGSDSNDADGIGSIGLPLSVSAYKSISGISDNNEDGILCGVFLGANAPSGSPPASLAFSSSGATGTIKTNFTTLSPKLDQTFFIGDGLTGDGTGSVQKFNVPVGATRLFLGIADADAYQGSPGAYYDNTGSFKTTFTVTAPVLSSISGTVYSDTNANGKLDTGEKGLSGETVFIDSSKSGKFVTGDPTALTNSSGNYTFTGLTAGTYVIREKLPSGYELTAPAAGDYTVALAAGQSATGYAFADAPLNAAISGTVFNDWNADKKIDEGELGLGGWTVVIDLKGTGKYVAGDPTVVTAVNGTWSFTGLAAGTYQVSVEPESFAVATTPTVLTITLKAGGVSSGNLFGEKAPA